MNESLFFKSDSLCSHGNRKGNCLDCDRKNKKEVFGQQRIIDEILEHTDEQLEIIKPALKDFVKKIKMEQPDVIYFLDKSARVFGTPFKKYLNLLGLEKIPRINYFNDHDLKGKYLSGNLNKSSDIKEFDDRDRDLKDKKIFFLDETYSSGKGAASLKKLKEIAGNENIFYFAFSRDEGLLKQAEINDFDLMYDIGFSEHKKVLDEIVTDSNFIIYNNRIPKLFSREAASLYLDEIFSDSKTTTVHHKSKRMSKLIDKEREVQRVKRINVPNASQYTASTNESEGELKLQRYQAIVQIKEKIFKTLQSLNINKSEDNENRGDN